jgi:hypothetical protein
MKTYKESINVEPIAWALQNNKTSRREAEARAERQKIEGIPNWIIGNLKRFGNCYILRMKYNLENLSRLSGFKVSYSRCLDTQGYILFKEG